MFILNPGRTAVWSRWTTRRFSTLQCVSSANRTDNICSPDLRIRACGSAGLFVCRCPACHRPVLLLRPHLLRRSADPPCARSRNSSSAARTSSAVPPTRLVPAAGVPPLSPCRPAPVPTAGAPPLTFRRPALRSQPELLLCRPVGRPRAIGRSFPLSAAAPPFRRRYTRVAAGTPASPTGPRANGRCSSSARSSSARTSSAVPLTRPVPAAGASPPPPAPPPRRRMALFLPKCPVAKCQSAVPRRDPAILLTIWQRSPIGTTFVCFRASPVREPAGKMKTNN